MVRLLIPTGRRIAEVSWPAYSRRQGGTCDFMTTMCKNHCILRTNELEKQSFAFFEDHEPPAIVRKLIEEMNSLKATVICWFVGSGDCPKRMTETLIRVMKILSGMDVRQHGFTRNAELWRTVNEFPKCLIVLTVERDQPLPKGDVPFLVGQPNYKDHTVRISKLGIKKRHFSSCGGGWVEMYRSEKGPPKVMVEDCSLCLENNDGCFSLIGSE